MNFRTTSSLSMALLIVSFGQLVFGLTIDTVLIGNAGNGADMRYPSELRPNGVGSVAYPYRIGKTEVTNAQYVQFLNAVAASDPYGLYHTSMGASTWGGIMRSGFPGSYVYSIKAPALDGAYPYDNKPVVFVNWGDAARFSNWLHNGQPTGAQDSSTTEDGAYTLNGAMSDSALAAVTRNAGARSWLPSYDEWYKAAYHKNDGVTANYWDYPTGTSTHPNHNLPSSDTGNSANFWDQGYTTGDFYYPHTPVGEYGLSRSPYGTFDQGGNAREWIEATGPPNLPFNSRVILGGSWIERVELLHASNPQPNRGGPSNEDATISFRIATIVPEPTTVLLITLAAPLLVPRLKRRI